MPDTGALGIYLFGAFIWDIYLGHLFGPWPGEAPKLDLRGADGRKFPPPP